MRLRGPRIKKVWQEWLAFVHGAGEDLAQKFVCWSCISRHMEEGVSASAVSNK